MTRLSALMISLMVLFSIGGAQVNTTPEDRCRDILTARLKDQLQLEASSSLQAELERVLRMNDEELTASRRKQTGSGRLALAVAGVFGLAGAGGGGSESERLHLLRTQFQAGERHSLADDEYMWLSQSISNPAVFEAWQNCMDRKWMHEAERVGLIAEFQRSGRDGIDLRLSWRKPPWRGAADQAVVTYVTLVNLKYEGEPVIKKETAVGGQPITQAFRRISPDEDAKIIINTDGNGSASFVVPSGSHRGNDSVGDIDCEVALAALEGLTGDKRANAASAYLLHQPTPLSAECMAQLLQGVSGKKRAKLLMSFVALKLRYPLSADDYRALLEGVDDDDRSGVIFVLRGVERKYKAAGGQ